MRNWPVILVLLVVMIGLIIAGQINKAKSDPDKAIPGCMDEKVTTPSFMVVKVCAREEGTTGEHVGVLHAVRKGNILVISNYPKRNSCSYIAYPGGRILVKGSVARLILRAQQDYIDWGKCGPTVEDFLRALETDEKAGIPLEEIERGLEAAENE